MEEIGLEVPRSGFAHSLDEAEEIAAEHRLPDHGAPELHPRRAGHRHRRRPRRASASWPPRAWRPARSAQILVEQSIAGWKEFELEVMRDARRQLRRRLLHRELRPDGRAHRRLHHRGPGPDPDRRRVPGHARRRLRLPPPGRRRDGRLQRPVRRGPGDGRRVDHRDEPPGVALVGAGLEGHRLPHRQDRRPPGRRLPARRDPQRHHRGDAGVLRADHRLRGDQDPALGLREASRRRRCASAPACSRSARSWPSAAPSASRCRRRCARSSRAGPGSTPTRPRRRSTALRHDELLERIARRHPRAGLRARGGAAPRRRASTRWSARTGIDPWFVRQLARIVGRAGRRLAGAPALGPADFRRAKRLGFSDAQLAYLRGGDRRPSIRAARLAARRAGDLQDGRHLRGRVRGLHARTTTPPTRRRTRSGRSERARVIILGSGPNRIGQGIEFDYCCVHASMALRDAGLRDRDGQLQPRDGLDRLRHLGPPLLRAADRRGRGQRARRRAGGRAGRVAGVIVSPRRPDAAQAGRLAPARAGARHQPGLHRPGRGPRALERAVRPSSASPSRPGGTATTTAEALAVAGDDRLPGAGAPELRPRRPGHGDRLRRRRRAPGHARR